MSQRHVFCIIWFIKLIGEKWFDDIHSSVTNLYVPVMFGHFVIRSPDVFIMIKLGTYDIAGLYLEASNPNLAPLRFRVNTRLQVKSSDYKRKAWPFSGLGTIKLVKQYVSANKTHTYTICSFKVFQKPQNV